MKRRRKKRRARGERWRGKGGVSCLTATSSDGFASQKAAAHCAAAIEGVHLPYNIHVKGNSFSWS